MAKKKSIKRTAVAIPESTEKAAEFVGKIGKHQRELDKIQTNLNNQVEKLKAQAVAGSLSYQTAIDQLFEGLFIFAQSRRDELTGQGKTKTVQFPTGTIQWRLNPPAVSVASQNVKKVIALCQSSGLDRFVRLIPELDREAMLKEPGVANQIKGVKIKQKEQFVVKPSEATVEISRDTTKLQKAIK